MMKVMVLVKATAASEAGQLPAKAALTAMGQFNEQLVQAGVMLAGEGLQASERGCRLQFGNRAPVQIPGPFPAPSTLVAGFWLWQVRNLEEAVEWARRAPFTNGEELELRPVMGAEDFGEAFTVELRAQEQRLREQSGAV